LFFTIKHKFMLVPTLDWFVDIHNHLTSQLLTLLLVQGLAHEKLKQFPSRLIKKLCHGHIIPSCSFVVANYPNFSMLLEICAKTFHICPHTHYLEHLRTNLVSLLLMWSPFLLDVDN
jgi:hypothetical protein